MDQMNRLIEQLETIEKMLDEAGIPGEDEVRIFSLVDRVQWLINVGARSVANFYRQPLAEQLLEMSRVYVDGKLVTNPGKLALIKILRLHWDCSLVEAKDKIEELFDFSTGEAVIR